MHGMTTTLASKLRPALASSPIPSIRLGRNSCSEDVVAEGMTEVEGEVDSEEVSEVDSEEVTEVDSEAATEVGLEVAEGKSFIP